MTTTTKLEKSKGGPVRSTATVRRRAFDPGEGVNDIVPDKDALLASKRRYPNYALADALKKAGA